MTKPHIWISASRDDLSIGFILQSLCPSIVGIAGLVQPQDCDLADELALLLPFRLSAATRTDDGAANKNFPFGIVDAEFDVSAMMKAGYEDSALHLRALGSSGLPVDETVFAELTDIYAPSALMVSFWINGANDLAQIMFDYRQLGATDIGDSETSLSAVVRFVQHRKIADITAPPVNLIAGDIGTLFAQPSVSDEDNSIGE